MAANAQQTTMIRGRLSWPTWLYQEAVARNAKSKFPKKDIADVRPDFTLLLDETQGKKFTDFISEQFLPWAEAQGKAGEKSGFTAAEIKKLNRIIDAREWDVDPVLGLIKPVHEKTVELAPEAVMAVSVKGFKGQDITRKALVRDKGDLKNSLDDVAIPPRGEIFPVEDTKLELYPGSIVAATVNLFGFVSAGTPGIMASAGTAVFVADADRFGGGGDDFDEDALFMELGED